MALHGGIQRAIGDAGFPGRRSGIRAGGYKAEQGECQRTDNKHDDCNDDAQNKVPHLASYRALELLKVTG